jgi:drug/metabolite transporter (DMT)-like permease
VGVLLALTSAVCYGLADYVGGILSRRAPSTSIVFAGQIGGLILCTAASVIVPVRSVGADDLAWGALSGVGTGTAMLFLYRGLTHGRMSVVVPLSAVGGLALPVLVGVLLLGDRPTGLVWIGMVASVPSLWLIARAGRESRRGRAVGSGAALLAGVGIAVQYLALAQAGSESGLWAVSAGRLAAVIVLVPIVARVGRPRLPPLLWFTAAANGGLAAVALVCYLVATRHDLVSTVVVLSSFYPAIPVLLAVLVLRERLTRVQLIGLLGAGLAVACLTS